MYRPAEIVFSRFFEGPTVEFVNSIGIGVDYTSPPMGFGALVAFILAPVLRSGDDPGVK
jgi:hypothetical protein